MHDLKISSSPIWRFADDAGTPIRLSLPEVLNTDTPLHHHPHVGYLLDIQHELLATILQVAVDTIWPKGLTKNNYITLITTENSKKIRSLINIICDTLIKLEGFSLVGNSSFLQIPNNWRRDCERLPIAKLMWPFIPRVHHRSTAKGLRCPDIIPQKIGPDLTALYLYTSSVLFRAGTRYWTSGNLANRYLAHHHMGQTLRQRLFCTVLPGFRPEWRALQPFHWVSKCKNNGGLEYNDKPPSLKYFNGEKKIIGTANIRLFQATAISLAPPSNGQCDISRDTTTVFNSYHHLTDQLFYEKLSSTSPLKTDLKHPGIMGKMYASNDHPCAIPRPEKGKELIRLYDSISSQDMGNLPPWVIEYFSNTFPSHVLNALKSAITKSSNTTPYEGEVFRLKYSSTKQDIEGIYTYRKTGTFSHNCKVSQLPNNLLLSTIQETQTLFFKINRLLGIFLKGNNQNIQKTAISREISGLLWDTADQFLIRHFRTTKEYDNKEIKSLQQSIAFKLSKEGFNYISTFLDDYRLLSSITLTKQRFIINKLINVFGIKFMNDTNFQIQNNSIVQAGYIFAKTYMKLSNHEKAILQRSEPIYSSRFFWNCMNQAKKKDSKAYQPLYENSISILNHITPIQNGLNLGSYLCQQKQHINNRSIELLLSVNDIDSILHQIKKITHHIAFKLKRSPHLDFGVLIYDLSSFHFNPDKVKRRWAFAFFANDDY